MKKGIEVSTEILLQRNRALRTRYNSPLIKWYHTNLSKKEKYKLGLMSYEEFVEWQNELAEEAEREAEESALVSMQNESESMSTSEENESSYHTFWEGDEADRENISNDSYAEFLEQNGIDVSNKNDVSVDALM